MANATQLGIEIAPGWTLADAEAAIVESTIDHHRFPSLADRLLAMTESDEGLALFPDAGTLGASGVNIEMLAVALHNGLAAAQFGELFRSRSAAEVNGVLEQYVGVRIIRVPDTHVPIQDHKPRSCANGTLLVDLGSDPLGLKKS